MTERRLTGRVRSGLSGVGLILGATAIAGVASYVITWLIPHEIGFADYAIFAVFWSMLYLVVGSLSGVQQEFARATVPVERVHSGRRADARVFAIAAAGVVFVLIVGSAPAWASAGFGGNGWPLVWPLACGCASYVFVAVVAGSLYGLSRWRELALMIVADALLRFVALLVVLQFTHDVVALAWAAALPFPAALVVLVAPLRHALLGRTGLDVGYGPLTWNVVRTIVAGISTSIMVSGFPFFLGVLARGESKTVVGLVVLSITLTRAPLIVVAMSLQSYLVVFFRARAQAFWRHLALALVVVLAAGAVLAVLAVLVGPFVFDLLFPGQPRPAAWLLAVLVISAALVAALCVAAPVTLARGQHMIYGAAWVSAAAATLVALVLPGDFLVRASSALVAGPIVGLIVLGAALAVSHRRAVVPS